MSRAKKTIRYWTDWRIAILMVLACLLVTLTVITIQSLNHRRQVNTVVKMLMRGGPMQVPGGPF